MHPNCIMCSVANLLVRNMDFEGNVQKSHFASHTCNKGLEPALEFCCHGRAPTGIKEGSLILKASEMFLSLYMIFIERAAVVWAILFSTSGFDT